MTIYCLRFPFLKKEKEEGNMGKLKSLLLHVLYFCGINCKICPWLTLSHNNKTMIEPKGKKKRFAEANLMKFKTLKYF